MSTLEIIAIGYLFNIAIYAISIVYITIVMVTLQIIDKVEYAKLIMIVQQKKSRAEFLNKNIKSYKKYNLGFLFPFMKITLLWKFIYFSLKYGVYNGIIYILELEVDKLEQLYDLERGL